MDSTGCPPDDTENRQRVRYFAGQLLGQDDFEREQEYHRAALRRHNRALHGWGVASGFVVTQETSPALGVVVGPGYALDRCGREVMLAEQVVLAVPAAGEWFIAARAVETMVSEGIVRDDVEIGVIAGPCASWITLASVSFDGDQLVLDTTVRRALRLD